MNGRLSELLTLCKQEKPKQQEAQLAINNAKKEIEVVLCEMCSAYADITRQIKYLRDRDNHLCDGKARNSLERLQTEIELERAKTSLRKWLIDVGVD